MAEVQLLCRRGHTHSIYFDEISRKPCDHDKSDKVRGICVQCAMSAPPKDPDPRCPKCGSEPARILDQPAVHIKVIRG